MDMQLYALHVVPFLIFIYLAFLLFLRPPLMVVLASLLGGLTLGVINALGDLAAYSASWWHYTVTGLILHLPLPYYADQVFIYGGIAYLLAWRFRDGQGRWFGWAILVGVPLLGFLSNLLSVSEPQSALVWSSVLAGPLDFVLWLLMFYIGLFVFRQVAPRRDHAVKLA